MGHQFPICCPGGAKLLVAFFELSSQIHCLLFECRDVALKLLDVRRCTESGLPPDLLAEQLGELVLQLADACGLAQGSVGGDAAQCADGSLGELWCPGPADARSSRRGHGAGECDGEAALDLFFGRAEPEVISPGNLAEVQGRTERHCHRCRAGPGRAARRG